MADNVQISRALLSIPDIGVDAKDSKNIARYCKIFDKQYFVDVLSRPGREIEGAVMRIEGIASRSVIAFNNSMKDCRDTACCSC